MGSGPQERRKESRRKNANARAEINGAKRAGLMSDETCKHLVKLLKQSRAGGMFYEDKQDLMDLIDALGDLNRIASYKKIHPVTVRRAIKEEELEEYYREANKALLSAQVASSFLVLLDPSNPDTTACIYWDRKNNSTPEEADKTKTGSSVSLRIDPHSYAKMAKWSPEQHAMFNQLFGEQMGTKNEDNRG